MKPWLSDEELYELTGYTRPSRQARWLGDNRIKFYVNALNKVRVLRVTLTGPISSQPEKRTEPDFSKVRKARSAVTPRPKILPLAVRLANKRKLREERRANPASKKEINSV